MDGTGVAPGPISDRTFDQGFKLAAVLGLGVVAVVFWLGPLSPGDAVHVVVTGALFPVYLLFAACALGVWLGYDTDERNLELVTRSAEERSDDSPLP